MYFPFSDVCFQVNLGVSMFPYFMRHISVIRFIMALVSWFMHKNCLKIQWCMLHTLPHFLLLLLSYIRLDQLYLAHKEAFHVFLWQSIVFMNFLQILIHIVHEQSLLFCLCSLDQIIYHQWRWHVLTLYGIYSGIHSQYPILIYLLRSRMRLGKLYGHYLFIRPTYIFIVKVYSYYDAVLWCIWPSRWGQI